MKVTGLSATLAVGHPTPGAAFVVAALYVIRPSEKSEDSLSDVLLRPELVVEQRNHGPRALALVRQPR